MMGQKKGAGKLLLIPLKLERIIVEVKTDSVSSHTFPVATPVVCCGWLTGYEQQLTGFLSPV